MVSIINGRKPILYGNQVANLTKALYQVKMDTLGNILGDKGVTFIK